MKNEMVRWMPELGESVVVRQHEARCVKCFAADREAEVITFGLKGKWDAEDCTEVFHWCSCGHKWIEEPKPLQEKGYCRHGVFVGGMGADIMCGRCEAAGVDGEEV